MISGSQVTGKLTELAMKHFSCALWCRTRAKARVGAAREPHAGAQNHLGEMAALLLVGSLARHHG